jgi:hypothetical protein
MQLKKVVLPAPLGPMTLTIEPSSSVKSSALTAVRPPNRLVTFSGPSGLGLALGERGADRCVGR